MFIYILFSKPQRGQNNEQPFTSSGVGSEGWGTEQWIMDMDAWRGQDFDDACRAINA
jgi:hypothetical protein